MKRNAAALVLTLEVLVFWTAAGVLLGAAVERALLAMGVGR